MTSTIFTCILHHLRVYYEFTMWPAPSWLDSSFGRALHRYHLSLLIVVKLKHIAIITSAVYFISIKSIFALAVIGFPTVVAHSINILVNSQLRLLHF